MDLHIQGLGFGGVIVLQYLTFLVGRLAPFRQIVNFSFEVFNLMLELFLVLVQADIGFFGFSRVC